VPCSAGIHLEVDAPEDDADASFPLSVPEAELVPAAVEPFPVTVAAALACFFSFFGRNALMSAAGVLLKTGFFPTHLARAGGAAIPRSSPAPPTRCLCRSSRSAAVLHISRKALAENVRIFWQLRKIVIQ
jgi:hypothetical protein